MNQQKIDKVAAYSTSDEIQKWTSSIGRFASEVSSKVLAAEKSVCGACPFRNKSSVGGCLSEDCPVHMLRKEVNRVMPRTTARARELYKAKYSTSRSNWAA